ncbi:MAG TPA: glycosyltransferase family 4 protein [Bauldia sp.]|nr:glycosyltransferase family 4 protein [Bauldia sp.]
MLVATPLGRGGQGGIDRLNDLIFDAVERSPELNLSLRRLVLRGQGNILLSPFFTLSGLIRLGMAGLTGRVDLLHVHLSVRGSTYRKLILAALARRMRLPYVVHIHGSRFDTFWIEAGPRLARAIDRLLVSSAAVIVLGDYWATFVAEHAPKAASRIVVLPNATAMSSARRRRGNDKVHIVFLGALGERKGTPQLIAALGNMADRPDWTATIAGNGAVEDSREAVARLGIADRVAIPGWLDPDAVRGLIEGADVFVLPSFAENLPMSVLEAMACGTAVVATPVGAIPDVIVDGSNGLLVPPGDVDALTKAIRKLLDDPDLRQRLGEAALETHRERYNIEGYVVRLAAIWRRAAGRVANGRAG